MSVAFFFEANYGLVKSTEDKESRGIRDVHKNGVDVDRRTVYNMLESKFQDFGLPGSTCLLRFICETAQWNILGHNGLIGDLLKILLTPSSSADEGLPVEYTLAERQADDCGTTYSLCPVGIYEYITSTEE
ncbi:uncharacterized protein LOC107036719 [Diachasma alloeum]|uniref:uncharacterized protein LOC107036719 n=1 Tax=Diachasma alloeum TaxID=454923 RepID=UPI00073816F6|nr:uncharacterized protein LOC107036719 [Diachasma alloeum]